MEYAYGGGSHSADPFRCLDSTIDDMMSGYGDPNLNSTSSHTLESMDTTSSYTAHTPPSAYMHQSVSHPMQSPAYSESAHSSYFYHKEHAMAPPHTALGVNVHDPYMKFSPPTFHDAEMGMAAAHRMMPNLRITPHTVVGERPEKDMLTLLTPVQQQPQKEEREDKPKASKEMLLELLSSLTPNDVVNLREKIASQPEGAVQQPSVISSTGKVRPSGVATRVVTKAETSTSYASPAAAQDSRLDTFDDEDYEDDEDEYNRGRRRGPRTERRTAHNLIEKKYRCSINDRIQALKHMLAGGAKMSKSATLRRAIEYIEQLEQRNKELSASVQILTQLCNSNGLELPVLSKHETQMSPLGSASSPNSSQPSPSPDIPRPKRSRMSMDQSRVSLFAIVFALMVWNPIASLSSLSSTVPADPPVPQFHARTLQSLDAPFDPSYAVEGGTDWWQEKVIRPLFIWALNIFIVLCVLTRLLVYGEPVHDFKSRTWATFLSTKRKAQTAFESENKREAHRQLVECLQILDRPLPHSQFDEGMAVTWQVIRHLLNGMWIGRWFSRRRRDERKPVTVVCKCHAHTALIYHQLNQLDLLGVVGDLSPSSRLRGLYLALSAVNLAESAGASVDGLPHSSHAHIFIAAALRCRVSLPSFLSSSLHKYFMHRAKRHMRKSPVNSVNSVFFLFHPLAGKFCSDRERVRRALEDAPSFHFSSTPSTGLALHRIRSAFKVHLLQRLLDALRVPNPSGSTIHTRMHIVDVSQLLLSLCTEWPGQSSGSFLGADESAVGGDEVCTWWAHLLTCGLLWRRDNSEQAKTHYAIVRRIPAQLLNNPLALAAGHAFCARKLRLDDTSNANFTKLVCTHVSKCLESIRASPVMRDAEGGACRVQEGMKLLALEWSLCSVLAAWRSQLDANSPYWTQDINTNFRALYQDSLLLLNIPSSKKKNEDDLVGSQHKAFALTSRMLNGANAVETYSELLRLQKSVNEYYAQLPSVRDDTPLSYHLHVLTKLHLPLCTRRSK